MNNYYISAIGCYDYSDSEPMSLRKAKAKMKKRYKACIADENIADTDGIEITDTSIEIGMDEFYQSWIIRKAIEGNSIVDKLRGIVYMTEDCGREETKYQWTLEDATAGSIAAEIGSIVKDVIENMEKDAVEVKSQTSDETFLMTPDQIYAAYRHQEHEFLVNDARNHLNGFIYGDYYESPDDIDADEKAEIEADFLDKYHMTVEDAFDIIDDFVAEFHEIFDANIGENTLWETAIENVLRSLMR